jgi:hypothetical protein
VHECRDQALTSEVARASRAPFTSGGGRRKVVGFRHRCLNRLQTPANRAFSSAESMPREILRNDSTMRLARQRCCLHGPVAMEKVVGSSPIIRFAKPPGNGGFLLPSRRRVSQLGPAGWAFLQAPSLFFGDAADSAQDPLGAGREIQRDDLEQPVASAAARCDALRANVSAARLKWAFDVAAHRLSGDSACSKGSAPRVRGPAANDVDVRPARPRPRPRARRP